MKRLFKYLRKRLPVWILGLASLAIIYLFRYELVDWVRSKTGWELPQDPRPAGISDLQWCEQNYSEELSAIARKLDLPYEYLMALAVLECSGNKPAGHRFEKHIFNQLKKVKEGKRSSFEGIKQRNLQELDEEGLKNLATSWGPFQLMGYKVIQLDLTIRDIRDEEDAAYQAARWIKKEYGHFLAKEKWKDAFHYHNTGKRFPLSGRSATHNPYYVSDGVKYMKYFEKRNPLKGQQIAPAN